MTSNTHRSWLRTTLETAKMSDCASRHGALIVKGGRLIAAATNRPVSHPVSVKFKAVTIHAEQQALMRAGERARGATMYIARDHAHPLSAPCAMCRVLALEAGIKRIVFYAADGVGATERLWAC